MNTLTCNKPALLRTALVDITLLAVASLIPTLSHLTALPLYQINPMMLVLLGGMLLVRGRANAILLAVLLPVVSMVAVGMPTPLKALCMVAEMLTMVSIFTLMERSWNLDRKPFVACFGSLLAAMLCGKAVYYALKALLLSPAVLVSTPVATQVLAMLGAALLFCLCGRILSRR